MPHLIQGALAPVCLPLELIVCLSCPGFASMYGTRAMLEAEGIIPPDFEWPQKFDDARWRDARFRYCVRRSKPPGAKGHKHLYVNVDWWRVIWSRCSEEGVQ